MAGFHLKDIEAQWSSSRTREARRVLWEQLTGPLRLWFSACRDIVQQRDVHTLDSWLNPDDPIKQEILTFDANQSAVLQAHLLCARLALTCGPCSTPDELDACLRPLVNETGFAYGCLRDLTLELSPQKPSLQPERMEELYVLLVEEGRDEGVVGLLSLQVMPNGDGDLYPHHELAFVSRDEPFRQAEHDVRDFLVSHGLWLDSRDVRWRLIRPFDNRPVRRLAGASMGAAFALGLSKLGAASHSRIAEKLAVLNLKQIAISATCDASGRLGKVEHVGPKILAGFDAAPREFLRFIVVSSDCDTLHAWQSHPFSSPQVILAQTYDEAVDKLHEKQYGLSPANAVERRRLQIERERETGRRHKRFAARLASAQWTKAVLLGLLTAMVGLAISILPLGLALEERFGLEWLFKHRGVRQPPAEVVIVHVDRNVARNLGLDLRSETWPRELHAQLTQHLARAGVTAIAFDILFKSPHQAVEDLAFADAIRQAKNVVLFASLQKEPDPWASQDSTAVLHIERLENPMPLLAQAAAAVAPFPLPKVPFIVRQYWTFKTGFGDKPTLPVVMFQLVALEVYDAFRHLVEDVYPAQAAKLPRDRDTILNGMGVESFIGMLRSLVATGTLDTATLLKRSRQITRAASSREHILLRSMIKLHQKGDSRYLDFYGPPKTITFLPYDQVRQLANGSSPSFDFRGKVVFVGFSESAQLKNQDEFHTVFSQEDGSALTGVEIAATAFANLLEDRPIQLCSGPLFLFVIIAWGGLLGVLCRLTPTVIAIPIALGFSVLFYLATQHQFATAGTWYPLIIPIGVQLPVAFVGAIIWRYFDTDKERRNLRQAATYYIPEPLVEAFAKDVAIRNQSSRVLYGICLFTDAEQYTTISEKMTPEALGAFMNAYYAALFEPVQRHGGWVSDVLGDAVLAIWAAAQPEAVLQEHACLAALDIAAEIQQFKEDAETWHLPTRIGLHAGPMLMGNVGAYDRYEYRALGDIVNTASRVEGLNKTLGTRILASQEVVHQLDGILTRELGVFRLAGKSQSLVVHELLCCIEGAPMAQRTLCAHFVEALDLYRKREWDQAIEQFSAIIHHPDSLGDGPSLFYLKLCEQHRTHPPLATWTGVVHMSQK